MLHARQSIDLRGNLLRTGKQLVNRALVGDCLQPVDLLLRQIAVDRDLSRKFLLLSCPAHSDLSVCSFVTSTVYVCRSHSFLAAYNLHRNRSSGAECCQQQLMGIRTDFVAAEFFRCV